MHWWCKHRLCCNFVFPAFISLGFLVAVITCAITRRKRNSARIWSSESPLEGCRTSFGYEQTQKQLWGSRKQDHVHRTVPWWEQVAGEARWLRRMHSEHFSVKTALSHGPKSIKIASFSLQGLHLCLPPGHAAATARPRTWPCWSSQWAAGVKI